MNAAAFSNRLIRDLKVTNLAELTADGRQEIQDAINASIQQMHDLSPDHSKTGVVSIVLDAPIVINLGVTKGSNDITGYVFPADYFYRTIRITGDGIDNQIFRETALTHAYGGETGTVSAIVYCDAVTLPEQYAEVVSDPYILENDGRGYGGRLVNCRTNAWIRGMQKNISRPCSYWMEPNARNQNPPTGPVVMRLGSYPDRMYRLQADMILTPVRVNFSDLLTSHATLPIRAEHVEAYLLPIAREKLTESSLWADKETISRVREKGEKALAAYSITIPQYLGTPSNRIHTRRGF